MSIHEKLGKSKAKKPNQKSETVSVDVPLFNLIIALIDQKNSKRNELKARKDQNIEIIKR